MVIVIILNKQPNNIYIYSCIVFSIVRIVAEVVRFFFSVKCTAYEKGYEKPYNRTKKCTAADTNVRKNAQPSRM